MCSCAPGIAEPPFPCVGKGVGRPLEMAKRQADYGRKLRILATRWSRCRGREWPRREQSRGIPLQRNSNTCIGWAKPTRTFEKRQKCGMNRVANRASLSLSAFKLPAQDFLLEGKRPRPTFSPDLDSRVDPVT